jgi:hypothetical protein
LAIVASGLAMRASAGDEATPANAPLGTLFYSPAERTTIVGDRQQAPEAPARNSRMKVSGVVTREHGNSTAWVNGQVVHEGQPAPPASPVTMHRGGITLGGTPVRVGETLDLITRERGDIVAPGAVILRSTR